MKHLEGKGFFIWKIDACENGQPDAIVRRAREAGLGHVLVKIADGDTAYNRQQATQVVQALKQSGIQVWGWQYIYGATALAEADMAIQRIMETGVEGFVVNAEVEFEKPARHAAAIAYMERLRSRLPDVPIGLSSFRYPVSHTGFAWAEFLSHCTLNLPQVYWINSTDPAAQIDRSVAQFQRVYPIVPIVPTGAAYEERGWRPRATEISSFLTHARALGLSAANFWCWDYAGSHQGVDLWSAVADFDWPVGPPSAAAPELPARLFAAMSRGDINQIASLYQPDAVLVTATHTLQGLDALQAYYANFLRQRFPEGRYTLVEQKKEGESTWQVQWTATSSQGMGIQDGSDTIGLYQGLIQYHSSVYHVV